MSEQTEPVRRFWERAWSRGEIEVLDEVLAPVWRENGQTVSVSEFKQGIDAWRRIFPDFEVKIEELLTVRERVVSRVWYTGTQRGAWGPLPPSGKRLEAIGIDIFTVRDGRIHELWHAVDHLPVVRQLGGRIVSTDPG